MPRCGSSFYTPAEQEVRRALRAGLYALGRRWIWPEPHAVEVSVAEDFVYGDSRWGKRPSSYHIVRTVVEHQEQRAAKFVCGGDTLAPVFSFTPPEGLVACPRCLCAV